MQTVTISPLRAAREWRGISLTAAARTAGIPLVQIEALEEGDTAAFATPEEMIAAAVLYGSVLEIARDEAMALLDRTIAGSGAELPAMPAVPMQSAGPGPIVPPAARASRREAAVASEQIELGDGEFTITPDVGRDAGGYVPEYAQDLRANGGDGRGLEPLDIPEFQIDPAFNLDEPAGFDSYDPSGSELDAWAAEHEDPHPMPRPALIPEGVRERVTELVGPERIERVSTLYQRVLGRTRGAASQVRHRMEASPHAVLLWAVVAGAAVIVLLLVALSMLGGESKTTTATSPPAETAAAPEEAAKPAKKPAKPAKPPVLARTALTIDVLNSGRVAGRAKQVAAGIEARGYKLGEVGNSSADHSMSMILFPPKLKREALRLSKETGITTFDNLPGGGGGAPRIVVIVV